MSPRCREELEQQLRTVIDELGKASAKVGGALGGCWGQWEGGAWGVPGVTEGSWGVSGDNERSNGGSQWEIRGVSEDLRGSREGMRGHGGSWGGHGGVPCPPRQAQGLSTPVTSATRMESNRHVLYILRDTW